MATMREIKRRKASIQSTQQITNAMKLVSTVKLQKSRAKAERTRPYTDMMYATVQVRENIKTGRKENVQDKRSWLRTVHHIPSKSNPVLAFVSTWSYLFWEAASLQIYTVSPNSKKVRGK